MSSQLPLTVRTRLEGIVQSGGIAHVHAGALAVSEKYRRLSTSSLQMVNEAEALGYLATRMPATYAAIAHVLKQIGQLMPDFAPINCLDVGAGPGTASLALRQFFGDIDYTLVEPNKFLLAVGAELGEGGVWVEETAQKYTPSKPVDMVIMSYMLNEVASDDIVPLVQKYWASCTGVMVVLEPGTPHGAGVIARIRNAMVGQAQCHLLGPCPQSGTCPLADSAERWCHFSTRVERSKLHKLLKGGDMGYEDEKFSWVAFSRAEVARPSYRLLGHPTGVKVRVVQVCNDRGAAETRHIAKSDPLYKIMRKAEWGDGV